MPFPRRITQRKALRTNSIHSASPTLLTQAVILTLTPAPALSTQARESSVLLTSEFSSLSAVQPPGFTINRAATDRRTSAVPD